MIDSKLNLTLVGAFVVLAVASLLAVLAVLAGRAQRSDLYYTEYTNVSGLKFGSQVMFEGYPIGQVDSIEPMQTNGETHFRVALKVAAGWQIPEDSLARSVAPGVLAPQMIAITAGSSTRNLAPGEMIRPAESADLLSSISVAADSFDQLTDEGLLPLLDNINQQVSRIGEILDLQLKPLVGDAGVVVSATADNWPDVMRQINVTTANLASTSARFNVLLSDERLEAIDRLIVNADRTAISLADASGQLAGLLASTREDLQQGASDFRYTTGTLARYAEPIAQSLDSSARNFEEFSRLLRQNPSLLISTPAPVTGPAPPLRLPE